nr:energy transducer TonB [uncultured Sphingomonas sp.]
MKIPVFLGVGAGLAFLGVSPLAAQESTQEARNAANNEVIFKNYPPRALAAREQGTVQFKVKLDREGHPTECFVTGSSGYAGLDNETCSLILLHAKFKPMRNDDGQHITPTLAGAVNWKIPGAAPIVKMGAQVAQVDDLDKMICKRELETGSLTRSKRTCMTKREWRASSDEMKQPWQDMQGIQGSTHGN